MPNFERFTKRMVPLTKSPYVTLQKRGIMSLNKSAWVLMDSPAAVEFFYDAQEKIIAMRGIDPAAEHAYPMRGVKTDGPFVVSGTAFTKYYEIPTEVSTRYPAYIEDGYLCVDLKQEGTEVTSNRVRRDSKNAASDDADSATSGEGSPEASPLV
jgi:hypothetical protein